MLKKLWKTGVNSGWVLCVGAIAGVVGNALYEIIRYVLDETLLKTSESEKIDLYINNLINKINSGEELTEEEEKVVSKIRKLNRNIDNLIKEKYNEE